MTPEMLALKRATGEMIKGVGGLEDAASHCRVGKSVLGDNQSPNRPDSFVALDVVAALEPLSRQRDGWPHVTRALARQLGFLLVPLPSTEIDPQGMNRAVTRIARELGHVANEITEAEADGIFEPHEAVAVLREVEHLETETAALRVALERLAANKEGVRI